MTEQTKTILLAKSDLERIALFLNKGEGNIDDVLMFICEQDNEGPGYCEQHLDTILIFGKG